jgi:hypothetical protein
LKIICKEEVVLRKNKLHINFCFYPSEQTHERVGERERAQNISTLAVHGTRRKLLYVELSKTNSLS